MASRRYERVSIYLDSPGLREHLKVGAARRGISVSEYCLGAVRRRLVEDGLLPPTRKTARGSATSLDNLRRRVGRIGIKTRDLVDDGRSR